MRISYLYFAYKNPKLIERTIRALSDGNASFFVHIDAKSDIRQFDGIHSENVHFTKARLPVYWAEFSGVEAIILLMREALKSIHAGDYFVLLSGSEYPLRSAGYIQNFFETNRGAEFINCVRMPNADAGKPISRFTTIRYPVRQPVARFAFRALAKFGLARRDYRKHLRELEPYGGNTWWALSREACAYVLDYHQNHPHLAQFFERVFSPEEYFIHTILGNSRYKSRMRRSLVFEDWSAGGGHPAIISEKHLQLFNRQDKVGLADVHGPGELLFARKLTDETLGQVNRLDEMIEHKESRGTQPMLAAAI